MKKDYDVIVIGAGNGGLAAAAFTAKNGLKTLIVDKHNIPGGSATSFKRGRFEFEISLHELCTVGTKENPGQVMQIFDSLGSDCEWCTHMDGTFHLVVPEEGIDADMPCGVPQFCQKLEELVPGSGKPCMEVFKLGMESAKALTMLTMDNITEEMIDHECPNFKKIGGHSITEVLDALGMPEKAQKIVSTYWCYLGAPADVMDFATYARMLLGYVVYGAGMPKYRSHEISLSLEKVIRDHGGEIWYNTEINKILVKDGKAYGVVIDGKEYDADYIVSNAYPDLVYGRMIDPEEVPKDALKLVNSRDLGLSFVTVYLGMNKTKEELGIPSYSNFITDTGDSNESYKHMKDTQDYGGYVILNCLNEIIPDCTPEGTCQLFLTTAYFGDYWNDVNEDNYEDIKTETARKMIEHCEKALGIEIMPYIEEIEIATPVTFARYLNTPQGTPYGYQLTKNDSFLQRLWAYRDEPGIENLKFVGAATKRGDGYSSAYISGLDAGQEIVRAEKEKGAIVR